MKILKGYLLELSHTIAALAVFVLGLASTAITFVPGLGFAAPRPGLIRTVGIVAMVCAFVVANYRVYTAQRRRIEELDSEVDCLRRAAAKATTVENAPDEDAVRRVLLRHWQTHRSAIPVHILAAQVAQDLGWSDDRLNTAGLKATGDFGTLKISFDGLYFTLERIPI